MDRSESQEAPASAGEVARKLRESFLFVGFWLCFLRGFLALLLGIAILLLPEKTRPAMALFMGLFFLATGGLGMWWGVRGDRGRGLSLATGAGAIIVGLGMVIRNLFGDFLPSDLLTMLLGSLGILTGILHLAGGFRGVVKRHEEWSWEGLFMGILEVALGAIVILEPSRRSPAMFLVASIWAILIGIILIADAFHLRRIARRMAAPYPSEKTQINERK